MVNRRIIAFVRDLEADRADYQRQIDRLASGRPLIVTGRILKSVHA